MFSAIDLLNNRALHTKYTRATGSEKRMALFEMARRVGTSGAMVMDEYRENLDFRDDVDRDTVQLFTKYKLNGGQDDTW